MIYFDSEYSIVLFKFILIFDKLLEESNNFSCFKKRVQSLFNDVLKLLDELNNNSIYELNLVEFSLLLYHSNWNNCLFSSLLEKPESGVKLNKLG